MRTARLARLAASGGAVWVVVAIIALYALAVSPEFRTIANLTNLSRQMIILSLVSLAQFIVVIGRGVDLSIGANVRLTSIVVAILMDGSDERFLLGVLGAVAISLVIGAVNGIAVAKIKVEPFIATLGSAALFSGLALYIAATPKGRASPWWADLYGDTIGPIPVMLLLAAVVWVLVWLGLDHTRWGRHLYAVGGDPHVSRLSGLRVDRVTMSGYLLAGLIGGIAGLALVAATGVGDPTAAASLEFDSLAVVIIGGASLAGGRGNLLGVLGGVVLFSMLGNVFNLLGVEVWYQDLARGAVILVAAALFVQRRPKPTVALAAAPALDSKGT